MSDWIGFAVLALAVLLAATALFRAAGRIVALAAGLALSWWLWRNGLNVWDLIAAAWQRVLPWIHGLIRDLSAVAGSVLAGR